MKEKKKKRAEMRFEEEERGCGLGRGGCSLNFFFSLFFFSPSSFFNEGFDFYRLLFFSMMSSCVNPSDDIKVEKEQIRDVWESNLETEMDNVRCIVDKYPYISMVKKKTTLLALCLQYEIYFLFFFLKLKKTHNGLNFVF